MAESRTVEGAARFEELLLGLPGVPGAPGSTDGPGFRLPRTRQLSGRHFRSAAAAEIRPPGGARGRHPATTCQDLRTQRRPPGFPWIVRTAVVHPPIGGLRRQHEAGESPPVAAAESPGGSSRPFRTAAPQRHCRGCFRSRTGGGRSSLRRGPLRPRLCRPTRPAREPPSTACGQSVSTDSDAQTPPKRSRIPFSTRSPREMHGTVSSPWNPGGTTCAFTTTTGPLKIFRSAGEAG